MDAFVSRKRRKTSPLEEPVRETASLPKEEDEESTDIKLAILSSLHPNEAPDDLLEVLLSCEGSVEQSLHTLSAIPSTSSPTKSTAVPGIQSALSYAPSTFTSGPAPSLTKKGRTLHLYSPTDIAAHTPCSIIHNFLPTDLANALLNELLVETPSYTSATFRLFDNVVQSPHTAQFYVTDSAAVFQQKQNYLYNGSTLNDVREILPVMRQVSVLVKEAVNQEIQTRIQTHQAGKKLKYQCPREWHPNAAFVNCYDGAKQSVGWHTDQLSYLGPHPVIGSLSLGVAREFRVRRIVPPDTPPTSPPTKHQSPTKPKAKSQADKQGQISIHLPHNSLLVMHATCQEEYKHSIAPASTIIPHPIAGNKRINITYRWYRDEFHPKFTPRCKCGVPCVLKCVMKAKGSRGRYMWMCQVGGRVDQSVREEKGSKRDENMEEGSGGGAGGEDGDGNADGLSDENGDGNVDGDGNGHENGVGVEDMGARKKNINSIASTITAKPDPETEVEAKAGRSNANATSTTNVKTGTAGCGFFEWAEFTDDGDPIWKHK